MKDPTPVSDDPHSRAMVDEVGEFVETLVATPAHRLTACPGWTAHELVAHLAAGASEEAALIEAHLAGLPDRHTEPFESREQPYRSLPDAELRNRLFEESVRLATCVASLGDDEVLFTGRPMTAADFAMHSRSECAVHRWDLAGRDDVGWAMLAEPALTTHAINILSTMTTLPESPGNRVARSGPAPARVILRSTPYDDVVLSVSAASCDISQQPIDDSFADIELEAAQRLLLLWGRREPSSPIELHAEGAARQVLESLMTQ
jgi:uncharacterized protein (TIGR03083 family)